MSKAASNRILSLVLALCLVFGMAAMTWADDSAGEGTDSEETNGTTETTATDGEEEDEDQGEQDEDQEDGVPEDEAEPQTMAAPTGAPVTKRAANVEIPVNTLTTNDNGPGWDYDQATNILALSGPGPFVLTGTNTNLGVRVDFSNGKITLRNCIIEGRPPFDCNSNRVELILEGNNRLVSQGSGAGVKVADGADLTIAGSGSLYAEGSIFFPGIGGNGSVVTITGDVKVTSKGGLQAAGIGGGNGQAGGVVSISGNAQINAQGAMGADIGGGGGCDGGQVTITGGRVIANNIGGDGSATEHGTLHISGGAYVELPRSDGNKVNRTDGSLQIGECTIVDGDSNATSNLSGTYHWLLVADGTLDRATVEDFWLRDTAGRQIIRAGDSVTVEADNASTFSQWYTSANITDLSDSNISPASFTMPDGAAWIATTDLYPDPPPSGGGSGTTGGGTITTTRSGSSDSGGTYAASTAKTQLPASAFSWSGRTLTINYDGITPLGLTKVEWDGVETDAFSKYSGSVVIRFDQDFIDSQSTGSHTVRVEFLNHYGETTVTVGQTGTQAQPSGAGNVPVLTASTNDNMNPSTGR